MFAHNPPADRRSNIEVESRAKNVGERLINLTDDTGVQEALGLVTTREIAHQQPLEQAMYSMQPNFPAGKRQCDPKFTNVYFNMASGEDHARGPWDNEPTFECVKPQLAVDGGSVRPKVSLSGSDKATAADPKGTNSAASTQKRSGSKSSATATTRE